MGSRPGSRTRGHAAWWLGVALGWLALVGSYLVVRPMFGLLSVVTVAAVATCWLSVICVPSAAAAASARRGSMRRAASFGGLVGISGLALWVVGLPQHTPQGLYDQHRQDLTTLASEYGAGLLGDDELLPWRLRLLSIDGRAHERCGFADSDPGERQCALYLPMWEDWRGETGGGFAYFPTAPPPDTWIATAPGDAGRPIWELGDGWWLVD